MIKSKNKTIILSIIIFLIIFVILGLPHTNWGFKTDDYGNIFHSNIKSWHEFFKFFYEGNIEAVWLPSNQIAKPGAFFAGLFRPLSFVYYVPQFFLFNSWAYGYYLVSVGFHALATVLLFNLLLVLTGYTAAFMLALLFGFHPSLYNWLGWTSAQSYFIEITIVLLIILLLVQYVKTQKALYCFSALALYPCTLFLKEASIVFPVWVVCATYLFARTRTNFFTRSYPSIPQDERQKACTRIQAIITSLKVSSGFWCIALGYLFARLSLFPMTSNTSTLTFEPNLKSFITRMSSRLFDFITYTVDILGLSWLPNSTLLPRYSVMLKSLLILICVTILFWLFIKSTKKSLILFLLFSTLLFTWPALLMHYQPRYIYLGIPFFMLALGALFSNTLRIRPNLKYMLSVLIFVLPLNIFFLHKHLTAREKVLHHISSSFQELVKNPITQNRSICFLALPGQWFHEGSAQAIWLYRNDSTYPVFQIDLDIVIPEALDKNYIEITRESNAFIFTSTNPEELYFVTPENNKGPMAKLTIDPEIQKYNPVYVTWDYYAKKFIILNN